MSDTVTKQQVMAAISAALQQLWLASHDSQGGFTADVTLEGINDAIVAAEEAML